MNIDGARNQKGRLLQHMRNGEWAAALRLAASFPRLGEHRDAIQRGWQATVRPEWSAQMGRDASQDVEAGIEALKARYER